MAKRAKKVPATETAGGEGARAEDGALLVQPAAGVSMSRLQRTFDALVFAEQREPHFGHRVLLGQLPIQGQEPQHLRLMLAHQL